MLNVASTMTCFIIYIYFLNLICVLKSSYINVEEFKTSNYALDISGEPVLKKERDSMSSDIYVHVMSKYGQQYECLLPEVASENLNKHDDSGEEFKDIKDLLEPMKSGSCLVKTKDWWTYEFCYGREIKQYHYEEGKGIVGAVISLGYFERDFDWNNASDHSMNKRGRYHSQYYVNGTKCDINDKNRYTEVRFICDDENIQTFARIDEPVSCQYIIEIHTDKICKHNDTKPLGRIKPKQITCNPVLDDENYEFYKQQQLERKRIAEEKKNRWIQKEKDKLLEIKEKNEKISSTKSDDPEGQSKDTDFLPPHEDNDKKDSADLGTDKDDVPTTDDVNDRTEVLQEIDSEIESLENYLATQMKKITRENKVSNEDDDSVQEETRDESNEGDVSKGSDGELLDNIVAAKKELISLINRKKSITEKQVSDGTKSRKRDTETDDEYSKDESKHDSKTSKADESSVKDEVSENIQTRKLKESIGKKLSQSGLNDGHKVQIKIIRINEDNDIEEWSDETNSNLPSSVQKTIIAYVQAGGMKESLNHMIKQRQTEKNYKFVFSKKKENIDDDNAEVN